MATLTNLESKLGEVTGLAMAAKEATATVIGLAKEEDESELLELLQKMNDEAGETADRCTELAGNFEGKKTAILEEARETKSKGAEMMKIYLDDDSDVLDGFEFLTMAEAGEAGHWGVLAQLAQAAGDDKVISLVEWARPIQERHFETAKETSFKLAAEEDPEEEQ